eukprot:SM000344S13004  [mRNA]  locus=s344:70650:74758:+ [translate_table: standard]
MLERRKKSFLLRDAYEDLVMDGLAPSRDTFHVLIVGAMRGSRLDDAFYFADQMKAHSLALDQVLYNCLISACARCLQPDRAFLVAEEMEAEGIQPKLRTYVALLNACAFSGRVTDAYELVQRMTEKGMTLSRHCYAALISAHKYGPHADDTKAKILELLEQSRERKKRRDATSASISGKDHVDSAQHATKEDRQEDLEYDEELMTGMEGMKGFFRRFMNDSRLNVYHAAMRAFVDLKHYEGVLDVFRYITEDGYKPDPFSYVQLMRANLKAGKVEAAKQSYKDYLALGAPPTLDLYLMLMESAILNFDAEGAQFAQELLAEMQAKGFFLNPRNGGHLLEVASRQFRIFERDDFKTADMIWEMLYRQGNVPWKSSMAYLAGLRRRNVKATDPRMQAVLSHLRMQKGGNLRDLGHGKEAEAGVSQPELLPTTTDALEKDDLIEPRESHAAHLQNEAGTRIDTEQHMSAAVDDGTLAESNAPPLAAGSLEDILSDRVEEEEGSPDRVGEEEGNPDRVGEEEGSTVTDDTSEQDRILRMQGSHL